jgi:diketogulonate reductase-like aldo/keto reductase
MKQIPDVGRRKFLRTLAATGMAGLLWPVFGSARTNPVIVRPIPSSGETIPVIGLGSWITFNVGNDPVARDACAAVMHNFFQSGGRLIDSSPMYGSSQDVIGYGLTKLGRTDRVFSADKVWTPWFAGGKGQIEASRRHWKVPRLDLMQVHNLVDWQEHLPLLFDMKAAGELRYVGITTSESRRHGEFERIMHSQPLDFIQVSYNIRNREVEKRILPLAQDRGIAVIANRPFQQSVLIDWAQRHPLPAWASAIDCANWAQFLLKFIISHPAVTCAIPATSRVDHVLENMGAAVDRLPDGAMRRRMIAYIEKL